MAQTRFRYGRYNPRYGRNRLFGDVRVSRDTAAGLALASLACGILGLFVASFLLGPIALVTGGIALHRDAGLTGNHRGMALTGSLLGLVATVLFVISLILGLAFSAGYWHWGG